MQTIGERLEEARKKRGISIREAAEATKIRGDYLQQFESNDFDIGLSEIYTRGFLRNYATFLKIPADRILNDYTSLGRSDTRTRQPSREIYGRMDISVASAADANDRAAPPKETTPEETPARGQNPPRYPRGSTSLPSGPDPALIFKYLKWGGIVVIVLIAGLVINALFSGGPAPGNPPAASTVPASSPAATGVAQSYTLVALDTAFVRVTNRIGADTDGEEVFKGTLTKGQSQVIPWAGPPTVGASAGANVQREFNGKRFPLGFTGYGHGHTENPPVRP